MTIEKDGHKKSQVRELEFSQTSENEISDQLNQYRLGKRVDSRSDSEMNERKRRFVAGSSDSSHITIDDDDNDAGDDNVSDCDERKRKGKGKMMGVPTKLNELLETKLLDGLNVWYIRGIKSGQSNNGLPGKIKGTSILCCCVKCEGLKEYFSPNQFELHAGSPNKRPADYIYLRNRNTLRDVLNACKHARLGCVTSAIRNAVSYSENESALCRRCRGPISEGSSDKLIIFCDKCSDVKAPPTTTASKQATVTSESADSYLQMYTSNGMSLHEISANLARSGVSPDENDDLCSVCHGAVHVDLLSCDGCPRVFHLRCVSLPSMPNDKWYCKLCEENFQMEISAAQNPNAIAAGRIPGVNAMEQITNRCIRTVKLLDPQDSACALCRIQDFCKSGFGPRTVIICDQCDKEYHVGCLKENKMQDLKELPVGDWFCSSDCERINSALKELLSKGDQTLPDDLIRVVKEKLRKEVSNGDDLEIRWRVLHGRKSSLDEIQPLLSKAVSVFHEQFDPILYGPNKQDLIPHMVYGRNVKEIEFGGMYCAVLSINSTIVSAGVFRVFCKEIAEIPLVATSKGFVGKGYFQCLYACVENFLKDLGVKNLLLPGAEETRSMWISKFGFNVKPQELNELTALHPPMHFDGTSMLHKLITHNTQSST